MQIETCRGVTWYVMFINVYILMSIASCTCEKIAFYTICCDNVWTRHTTVSVC